MTRACSWRQLTASRHDNMYQNNCRRVVLACHVTCLSFGMRRARAVMTMAGSAALDALIL